MAQQEMVPRKGSCLGRGLKILGLAVLALGAIYFVATANLRSLGLPIGEWPRLPFYVYTTSKITLTFDGEAIAIEGTTRCKRRFELNEEGKLWLPIIVNRINFVYNCEPEWLAHRFDDGSALLIGAYSARSPSPRTSPPTLPLDHYDPRIVEERIGQIPPSVLWLDNAESPTRAEYYYSMTALEDPRSRLTAISHSAEILPASLWTNLFSGRAPSNPSEQVPWDIPRGSTDRFVGYYLVELPKESWSAIPGLREQLAQLTKPTLIYPGTFLSNEQRIALSETLAGRPGNFPPRNVQGPTRARRYDARGRPLSADAPTASPELEVRVRPLIADGDTFRIGEDIPSGVVHLFHREQSYRTGTAELQVGDDQLLAPNVDLWGTSYLYIPSLDAIYGSDLVTFRSL